MDVVLTYFLCACVTVVAVLFCAFILTKYILVPYKHASTVIPPDQLFNYLLIIIKNELTKFDQEVLNGKNTGISNSDYENYYKYLVQTILGSLSQDYLYKLKFYMSEEHVANMVSDMVHEHLVEKIV